MESNNASVQKTTPSPRYTSVGIMFLGKETIYDEYLRRIKKLDNAAIQAINALKQGAHREIMLFDPEASEPLSEEMLIRRADSLAGISSKYSIAHSGYEIAVGWKQVQCIGTLNCTILAHCFHRAPIGLFIEPKYVPMFDWSKLLPILNVTDLKYIAVPMDDNSTIRREKVGTKFWDVVRNRCYMLLETHREIIKEIEDGYPYEIPVVTIGEKEVPMEKAFLQQRDLWLSREKLSPDEVKEEFYLIAARSSPWKDLSAEPEP